MCSSPLRASGTGRGSAPAVPPSAPRAAPSVHGLEGGAARGWRAWLRLARSPDVARPPLRTCLPSRPEVTHPEQSRQDDSACQDRGYSRRFGVWVKRCTSEPSAAIVKMSLNPYPSCASSNRNAMRAPFGEKIGACSVKRGVSVSGVRSDPSASTIQRSGRRSRRLVEPTTM